MMEFVLLRVLLIGALLYGALYIYTHVTYRTELVELRRRATRLVDDLKTSDPVTYAQLIRKFHPENIRFSLFALNPQDKNYTLDKRTIYICPDPDLDAMMFVLVHELAHMACEKYGHHAKFWATFRDLLDHSETLGLYRPLTFPTKFCGFKITQDFSPPVAESNN